MIEPIVNHLRLLDIGRINENKAQVNPTSFSEVLKEKIYQVNQLQENADQITQDFAIGKIDNIHEVTIATEKAQLALNLTVAIQNKVVETYQEIMRMQI